MIGLHGNQQRILEFLLNRPDGATLEGISEYLGITKTATKEHILKIERLGLLTFRDEKGKVGRPRRHYLLTPSGHDVFPKQYSWLSSALLEYLAKDMGSAAVTKMMEGLARHVSSSMMARFENYGSTQDLLKRITATLTELGYRATLKQSDLRKGAIIEATNCVYHGVAMNHPELCRFDIKLIEQCSGGMNVKLESCIARGGSVCRFCLRNGK